MIRTRENYQNKLIYDKTRSYMLTTLSPNKTRLIATKANTRRSRHRRSLRHSHRKLLLPFAIILLARTLDKLSNTPLRSLTGKCLRQCTRFSSSVGLPSRLASRRHSFSHSNFRKISRGHAEKPLLHCSPAIACFPMKFNRSPDR